MPGDPSSKIGPIHVVDGLIRFVVPIACRRAGAALSFRNKGRAASSATFCTSALPVLVVGRIKATSSTTSPVSAPRRAALAAAKKSRRPLSVWIQARRRCGAGRFPSNWPFACSGMLSDHSSGRMAIRRSLSNPVVIAFIADRFLPSLSGCSPVAFLGISEALAEALRFRERDIILRSSVRKFAFLIQRE